MKKLSIEENTEPKFKVGDWLVHNERRNIIKVVNATPLVYECVDILGYHYTITDTAIENNYHLWSIADAKDGDVLAAEDKDKIFIYNGKLDLRGRVCAYCGIYKTHDGLRFTECAIGNYFTYKEPYPATKEQCDQLEKAMADAGYIFDFEKKELNKIDARENLTLDGDLMVADCMIVEQNPAWSEEDETRLTNIIIMLKEGASHHFIKDDITKAVDWLKSIRPQKLWKPNALQMKALNTAICLNRIGASEEAELKNLLEQLKQL